MPQRQKSVLSLGIYSASPGLLEERARGVDQVPGQDVYNEGKDRGQVRGILRDRREQPALQSEEKSDMNNQFQAMTVNH